MAQLVGCSGTARFSALLSVSTMLRVLKRTGAAVGGPQRTGDD